MKENQYEIELSTGRKITIGLKSPVYEGITVDGKFIELCYSPSFPPRIICVWQVIGEPVILMFEAGDDVVYRIVIDINLKINDVISIEKKMKDGSSRRTDVKICF